MSTPRRIPSYRRRSLPMRGRRALRAAQAPDARRIGGPAAAQRACLGDRSLRLRLHLLPAFAERRLRGERLLTPAWKTMFEGLAAAQACVACGSPAASR